MISTSNDLRRLVMDEISAIGDEFGADVSFNTADDFKMYPHIVLTLGSIDLLDLWRKDYTLDADIYTKGDAEEIAKAYDIADAIEKRFQNMNAPQETILPTFFLRNRIQAPEDDHTITHLIVRMQVQLYEREAEEVNDGNID